MVSSQGTTSSTVSQLDNDSTPPSSSLPVRPAFSPNPNLPALPPLVTSTPLRSSNNQRAHPVSKNRLSTFSMASSTHRSRPQSVVFPMFHTSLPYALVRDFAYPAHHYMHYGPPPDPASAISTPVSEFYRPLSDPYLPIYGIARGHAAAEADYGEAMNAGQRLPATAYGDGPPWSEDEDLQSPIVTSSKSRRGRSRMNEVTDAQMHHTHDTNGAERTSYTGTSRGGRRNVLYVGQDGESAGGPGGEYITYPDGRSADYFARHRRSQDSQGGALLSDRAYHTAASASYDSPDSPGDYPDADHEHEHDADHDADLDPDADESRYSRNYQFTIASPDEEMHGKAVALYDFARENENELPLREGQVIWVSYRHGEGWLVAQDPKSAETGLVPEGFVRLVRDIEGGLAGLNGELSDGSPPLSPDPERDRDRDPDQGQGQGQDQDQHTPLLASLSPQLQSQQSQQAQSQSQSEFQQQTQPQPQPQHHPEPHLARTPSDKTKPYPPVLSQFTTSSKDLDPYPPHLLGGAAAAAAAQPPPPQSQSQTQTLPQQQSSDAVAMTTAATATTDKAPAEDSGTEEVRVAASPLSSSLARAGEREDGVV